ncbi:MAG: hypothetical protein V3S46_03545 [Nitrospinota bacterium]
MQAETPAPTDETVRASSFIERIAERSGCFYLIYIDIILPYLKGIIIKNLSIFLALCIALAASPAFAVEEPKERLVLMPLRVEGVDTSYYPSIKSAVAQGLSIKYKVLAGDRVE